MWRGNFNQPKLMSMLCRIRREHAIAKHDWQPSRRSRRRE
jgi:hypothetical protein